MTPRILAATSLVLLLSGGVLAAQPKDPVKRVHFAKDASSTTIKGHLKGDAGVVYLVGARAGQTLKVDLKTSNASNYFNVTAPGSDEALFIGSSAGNSYQGALPANGDYRINVYLMRNAARRNETADYTLSVAVAGTAAAASPDAKVAGTPYQATAMVGCAMAAGAKLGQCQAGVLRFPGGEATVEITLPGGGRRHIYFSAGKATSSDAPAGGFSARKDSDLNIISVGGKERYEFPDAFVVGG